MRASYWMLVPVSVFLGCATGPSAAIDRLNEARRQWLDQNISNYEVTVQRQCFCGEIRPVRISVRQSVAVSRSYVGGAGEPVPDALTDKYPSISGLFDFLEETYRTADQINVTFDQTRGFPTQAVIDYVKSALDDELTVQVSDFAPAP
jgi:Family of unknown function (DUF6174)